MNATDSIVSTIRKELEAPNINTATNVLYSRLATKPFNITSNVKNYRHRKVEFFYTEGMIFTLWGNRVKVEPYYLSETIKAARSYFAGNILTPNRGDKLAATLEEFEYLVNKDEISEAALHAFIENHPEILLGVTKTQIRSKIVLFNQDEDCAPLIPDFFIREAGSEFWDILEIKRPIKKLLNVQKNREDFVYGIHNGIAQLRTYARYFDNPHNRAAFERASNIKVLKPRLSLIVGRDPESSRLDSYRELKGNYPDLNISTYDELVRRAREKLQFHNFIHE